MADIEWLVAFVQVGIYAPLAFWLGCDIMAAIERRQHNA